MGELVFQQETLTIKHLPLLCLYSCDQQERQNVRFVFEDKRQTTNNKRCQSWSGQTKYVPDNPLLYGLELFNRSKRDAGNFIVRNHRSSRCSYSLYLLRDCGIGRRRSDLETGIH